MVQPFLLPQISIVPSQFHPDRRVHHKRMQNRSRLFGSFLENNRRTPSEFSDIPFKCLDRMDWMDSQYAINSLLAVSECQAKMQ
jgi:hypothetical protein